MSTADAPMTVNDLVRCAGEGDLVGVRRAIQQRLDLNARNKLGSVALQSAVDNKHLTVVDELLLHKADIAITNAGGWTLLHKAAYFNAGKDIVNRLVEGKADVCALEKEGWSVFHCVANKGASGYNKEQERVEMASTFLACGARTVLLLKDRMGDTALEVAARYNMRLLATFLMDYIKNKMNDPLPPSVAAPAPVEPVLPDDVNALDPVTGHTLLHTAVIKRNLALIDRLLVNKVNVQQPNVLGRTPLQYAVNGNAGEAIVKRLVEAQADIGVSDCADCSMLHYLVLSRRYSAESERVSIARALLASGAARVVALRNKFGQTAAEAAKHSSFMQLYDVLK